MREDLFKACPPGSLTNNPEGVRLIIDFLKSRHFVDEEKQLFEVKRQITTIVRKPNQNINDFLIEFENLRECSRQLEIEIKNDKLLALTLFECANLNATEETVLRGVCDFLTKDGKRYETVKRKLRDVCSKLHEKTSNNEEINITQNF